MVNNSMSTEKIKHTEQYPSLLMTSKVSKDKSTSVDINVLFARARKVKNKKYLINLVFFGVTISLFFIVGILLSF